MFTHFCPEFKNKCVCMGGGLPLGKGNRNIDLIELDVGKAVLSVLKPGIGSCFKVSLERKKMNHWV